MSKPGAASHHLRSYAWIWRLPTLLGPLAMLLMASAYAGEWIIEPRVSLEEAYTSNARLDPLGNENSDFVTTVAPSIAVHGTGARLTLDLDYELAALKYMKDDSLDEIRNQLSHTGQAELLDDLLFVDTRASISQQVANSREPTSGSADTASSNLATVAAYSISPNFRNHFGNFADSLLGYTFSQVYSNDLSNATTHRVTAGLVSGSQFAHLLWTLTADASETAQSGNGTDNSDGSDHISTRLAEAGAEYRLSRKFALLASVGYERIDDQTLSEQPNGPIGSIGFRWHPGPRTSLRISLNHRFDSNFVSGEFSYLIGPRSRLDASYTEGIQTSQTLFTENLSFLAADEFGNFVDTRTKRLFELQNPGFGLQDQAFRQKRFNLNLATIFGRNAFNAVAFHEIRETEADNSTDTAAGVSINFDRALSPVTNLDLTLRYTHIDFGGDDAQTDQIVGAATSLTYRLTETLQAVASASYTRDFSTDPTSEFSEFVLAFGIRKTF